MRTVPTSISCGRYPIKENTSVSPSFTISSYTPSISVEVPIVVPEITTLTPGIGSSLNASVTFPEILILFDC